MTSLPTLDRMTDLVFLVGQEALPLRRHDCAELARQLERITVIDGDPLPGARSAAAVFRAALDRGDDVVELEDPELGAVYGYVNTLLAPLPKELRDLCDAIARVLDFPDCESREV